MTPHPPHPFVYHPPSVVSGTQDVRARGPRVLQHHRRRRHLRVHGRLRPPPRPVRDRPPAPRQRHPGDVGRGRAGPGQRRGAFPRHGPPAAVHVVPNAVLRGQDAEPRRPHRHHPVLHRVGQPQRRPPAVGVSGDASHAVAVHGQDLQVVRSARVATAAAAAAAPMAKRIATHAAQSPAERLFPLLSPVLPSPLLYPVCWQTTLT